jgi:hypothetical protein
MESIVSDRGMDKMSTKWSVGRMLPLVLKFSDGLAAQCKPKSSRVYLIRCSHSLFDTQSTYIILMVEYISSLVQYECTTKGFGDWFKAPQIIKNKITTEVL